MSSSELGKIFALFGNKTPAYPAPKRGTQTPLPNYEQFKLEFDGIFARRYFANHGPLVQELDQQIARYLGVKYAICVTNETVALMIALASLDLEGKVIVPSLARKSCIQALEWAGLKPVFCEIELTTHCIDPLQIESLKEKSVSAILATHTWGKVCNVQELERAAEANDLKLAFEAFDAFGSKYSGRYVGGFGSLEVFSFKPYSLLNTLEGGCVTTDDDYLASRLRTARNFHGSHSETHCPLRMNAKMTEAQAALGLLALQSIDSHSLQLQQQWNSYFDVLSGVQGLSIIGPTAETDYNFSRFVLEVDDSRLGLSTGLIQNILKAENIFTGIELSSFESLYKSQPQEGNHLSQSRGQRLHSHSLQLPLGANLSEEDCRKIANYIVLICDNAEAISRLLLSKGKPL